jgi:hypothetical protein
MVKFDARSLGLFYENVNAFSDKVELSLPVFTIGSFKTLVRNREKGQDQQADTLHINITAQ